METSHRTTADLLAQVRARRDLPSPAERRRIREAAQVSQAACAAPLGVTQQTFASWERGTSSPNTSHLLAYVALLRDLHQAVAA